MATKIALSSPSSPKAPGASGIPPKRPHPGLTRVSGYWKALLGIALLLLGGLAVGLTRSHRRQQQEQVALEQLWRAQYYHEQGAYTQAMQGDGLFPGLLELVDKYPDTRAGHLARFYLAQLYVAQQRYEEAREQLESMQLHDDLLQPRAWALMGDLHCEAQRYEEALICYDQAAEQDPNPFFTPTYLMKAAAVHEELGRYGAARACYARLIADFPTAAQAQEAHKHLGRMEAKQQHG